MYEGDGNEDSTVTQNMSVHFPLRNFGSALAINESGQFAVLGGYVDDSFLPSSN